MGLIERSFLTSASDFSRASLVSFVALMRASNSAASSRPSSPSPSSFWIAFICSFR